ncbi:protein phosphatase 1 regulatory subunit 12A-like isoform X2 [Physella acuta]|uniref:protein phosphatase 1 regulatory subunit 12A-like isoform X2 n=1 Tax=Physella acuta TaxID=109671 RepID=UPI0027DD7E2E|nr:protein phosphatase 1 regulatory subunit 12A-like isoform X2 [Physella acuta]
MAADEKQVSALIRRHEQVKRWEDSDTNLEPVSPKKDRIKVKFQDGCVFLAACSSGDKEEVRKLLQRGADINTANVDGLTALHQACIDDNLDMVEFLVEQGADVDVCDNEGWTPLHATASCAFTEIARYLMKHGANVAAVNNDGDLPVDIAENDSMEQLLQEEMKKQGIDAEAARCEEEERMLEDANKWLKDKTIDEIRHPKTGATALHVAAAKGYMKVMNILMEAGVDINAEDHDGWTPLHAAAHWGQEEACRVLVENMCDMMHKNKAGHTAFDLAEKDMLNLLNDLKEKQATFRNNHERETEIILPVGHGGKRRSSVTRMSGDQKQNVIQRTSEEERAALASLHPGKNEEKIITSISPEETEDAETERKNEKNKQVSQQPQLPTSTNTSTTSSSWLRTITPAPLPAGAELRRPDMPKIEEVSESERTPSVVPVIPTPTVTVPTPTVTVPQAPLITSPPPTTVTPDTTAAVLTPRPTVSISKVERLADPNSEASLQDSTPGKPVTSVMSIGRDLVSRSISVPARLPTEKAADSAPSAATTSNDSALSLPSWRTNLRKTGSTSMVPEWMADNESNSLPRSASSPRLALDTRLEILNERLAARRPLSSTGSVTTVTTSTVTTTTDADGKTGDRNSYTYGQSYLARNLASRTSSYVPMYRRETTANTEEKLGVSDRSRLHLTNPSSTSSPISPLATSASTSTTSTTNAVLRRSYEPPKRDEETETQRKARAKHARQTRRSTQGVSLEDIEKAEEVLRSNEPAKSSVLTKETSVSGGNGVTPSTIPTATTTTTISSSAVDNPSKEDTSVLSGYRRRHIENDSTDAAPITSRGSYRRLREEKDLSTLSGGTTSDVTSNYIPRSQRNSAVLSSESGYSTSSSQNLSRTSSVRSSRLRNGEIDSLPTNTDDDSKKEDNSQDKKEEKKEPASLRAKRQRRERRSTGIKYDNEDGDKGKENKEDEEEKSEETNLGSSRYSSRYNSNSDVPSSDRSQRPVSYSDFSRSTGSLDIDYKKKYEDERSENEKLRKELEETKKSLLEAKAELDKVMKQREVPRNSDRDKRTLERRVSEMEEELKLMEKLKAENIKLKDENRALTRVVAKLSK